MKFSDRLSAAMERRGVKPADVVRATGLSSGAMSNYLHPEKERIPKAEELLKIATYLEVTMEELMTGETPHYPAQPAVAGTPFAPPGAAIEVGVRLAQRSQVRTRHEFARKLEHAIREDPAPYGSAELRAQEAEHKLAEIKEILREILEKF